MNDIKRNVSEILAICELEPEMKNIFVEGWTDYKFNAVCFRAFKR